MIYTYWRNLFILEQVKQIKLFVLKKKTQTTQNNPPSPQNQNPLQKLTEGMWILSSFSKTEKFIAPIHYCAGWGFFPFSPA